MGIFYVHQGTNYKEESSYGFLFSPQKTLEGKKVKGWTTMSLVKKGDIIFHSANKSIKAISIAKSDCYKATIPPEYNNTFQIWNNLGFRIDSEYYELENPLLLTDHKPWILDNKENYGPFDKNGNGKQCYLSKFPDTNAFYFIDKIIETQNTPQVKEKFSDIKQLLLKLINEERELDNYSNLEHQTIEDDIDSHSSTHTWGLTPRQPQYITSQTTNRSIPKRNPTIASNALRIANFKCEYNPTDKLFLRKTNNHNYTEPHHLIPISKQNDFKYSLDIEENIVSLCSHCHNLLHYGRAEDKKIILRKLFNEREQALKACGIKIDFNNLIAYYK